MKTFDLPSNSNYGDQPIPIAFPDNWDVHISKIHGYDTPALTEAQIAEKIHAAIGAKPISEGAAGKKSAVLAYKNLEKPGQKWHIHGWFCLIGCYLLMMYYTTVSGWMVSYFGRFLTGKFYSGMPAEDASAVFGQLLSDPVEMGILAVAIVIVGFIVCSFGLQKGLERVSKVMMLALLALILILAVHSLTLSGAAEGMKFYLLPSMDSIRENGLRSLITDAMNQAFFTLSLGIAAMEIFGSYMSDDHTLAGESIRICALDTFVALMAGTIIFPACFSYGVAPDNGPSLLFVTLPQVFVNMAGASGARSSSSS